ncbi:hypothetical protein E6P97_00960 [Patescibacteria group bacterium]|nr:MAG: hypothetical protein E6P97_00960 [Patescibacteria group bacterium]
MARLPVPGGDNGNWGEVLNDYLSQAHKPDGALKDNSITASAIANDAITEDKLDPIARGKLNGAGGVTNLSSSVSATTVTVASDTGTDATIPAATTSAAGVQTAADKTKLNGIAAGATANATDAQLRDRSTHTGSQAISTVTGLQTALDSKASSSHTHAIADVTGLQTALNGKQPIGDYVEADDLADVATSGDYNQLVNRPTIPTALGALTDVSTTGAASGQVLKYDGTGWYPAPDDTSSGGGGGNTNLSASANATSVTVLSDTGTDATLAAATTSIAGVMTAADKTKLDGVATGATANATNAQLRDRSTHTGTQAISTVSGLQSALDGKQAAGDYVETGDLATVATTGDYNNLTNRPTIPTALGTLTDVSTTGATDGQVLKYNSGSWSPAPDNTAGGATNLTASVNATTATVLSDTGTDATIPAATTSAAGVQTAADKTKLNGIAAGATANATDAQLRDRSTHTGSQAISTVTGLQTALDSKASSSHTHAIADVTNLQTTLDSKAATSHTHSAANITSGVLATARLGTGTADGTTYLRGDGTWATVVGGGGNGGFGPNWVAASNAPTAIKNAVTASGGYVCTGSADHSVINTALGAYGAVYLTEGDFSISGSINMPQGRALLGSGIRATRLNGASGLTGQFISITSDHTQVSRMTISATGQTANGIDANVTSQSGFTTGADACVVLNELVLRNIGGNGIMMRGSNNRDSKIQNIHVWNATGSGYIISCPDGSMMQCIAGTCGNHGFEVTSASNWRISQCKSWFSDADGFYLNGTRCIFESLEAQDNALAGIRMVGNLCTLTNFTADSNSYEGSANDNVHSGLEIGRLADGSNSGGYSITVNGGQAWDKNEASRGYKQRAGVRVRSGVRSLTLIGVDTGDPTGTHHNVTDGIIFDTPSDINHATNTVIARSHAVRMVTSPL